MTLGAWLTPILIGLFVLITFWWSVWLIKGTPSSPFVATGILVVWLVAVSVPSGLITWWVWWLTQEHTEHVCTYFGGDKDANLSAGGDNGGAYGSIFYDNTEDNLHIFAGEYWCGTVTYQNGAPFPWLTRGGAAKP